MTLQDIYDALNVNGFSVCFIIVILMSLVQITPIKFDPWTLLIKWWSRQITEDLRNQISEMNEKLEVHIRESEETKAETTRRAILDFVNSSMCGRKHTKEEFTNIIELCDSYEKFCKDKEIHNGYVDDAIKEIHRINQLCIQNNTYLVSKIQNGGDNNGKESC